jgi:cation transport regulator
MKILKKQMKRQNNETLSQIIRVAAGAILIHRKISLIVKYFNMYHNKRQLPEGVRENLPDHAQEIYLEAFNAAEKEYTDPEKRRDPDEDLETVCHKIAWNAVKNLYEKDDITGKWELKEKKEVSESK